MYMDDEVLLLYTWETVTTLLIGDYSSVARIM